MRNTQDRPFKLVSYNTKGVPLYIYAFPIMPRRTARDELDSMQAQMQKH